MTGAAVITVARPVRAAPVGVEAPGMLGDWAVATAETSERSVRAARRGIRDGMIAGNGWKSRKRKKIRPAAQAGHLPAYAVPGPSAGPVPGATSASGITWARWPVAERNRSSAGRSSTRVAVLTIG